MEGDGKAKEIPVECELDVRDPGLISKIKVLSIPAAVGGQDPSPPWTNFLVLK